MSKESGTDKLSWNQLCVQKARLPRAFLSSASWRGQISAHDLVQRGTGHGQHADHSHHREELSFVALEFVVQAPSVVLLHPRLQVRAAEDAGVSFWVEQQQI